MHIHDELHLQAAMMVPKALDYTAHLDGLAAVLAALITALGAPSLEGSSPVRALKVPCRAFGGTFAGC